MGNPSITRGIGKFCTDATGLPAFADDSANKGSVYPCVEVALVGEEVIHRFAGPVSGYEYDASGKVAFAVKEWKTRSTIRITVKAKAESDGSSEAQCVKNRELIREAFKSALYGGASSAITDPENPSDSLGVYRMQIGMSIGPTFDSSEEPVKHSASLVITVDRREKVKRAMTQTIKAIAVTGHADTIGEVINA